MNQLKSPVVAAISGLFVFDLGERGMGYPELWYRRIMKDQ